LPKKDEKRLATDPFERFLPQIGDSRKKKDADASENESTSKNAGNGASIITSKKESENTDTSTSKDTSTSTSTSNGKNKNASASKCDYESIGTIVNDGESKRVITSITPDESNSVSNGASTDTSVSASTITIERKSKGSTLVKMTHYFRPDQLKAIDELNEKSGRDKSELVRMAVDILIERAKVE
jgi:hypothetical protein